MKREKTVVVTGAGSGGCGRAITRLYARQGANVVVSDLSVEGTERTAAEIRQEGGTARPFPADVASESAVRSLLDFARQEFGGLDVVVNCASAPYRPDAPLEYWERTIAVDLQGAMLVTRHAIDRMREGGGGAIVHFGSTSGARHAPSRAPAYDVAKAGVARLATALAWLKEAHGIRVNCVLPDWVATPQVVEYVESLTPEQRAAEGIPPLTPIDDLAAAVVGLASDEALAGRALVWWSGETPGFIPVGDRGYSDLEVLAALP